jgi:transposase
VPGRVRARPYEVPLVPPLILNWFLALGAISAGTVEGFNGKAKLTTRNAYGFRTPEGIEFALLHVMGNLPEPESTHRFC